MPSPSFISSRLEYPILTVSNQINDDSPGPWIRRLGGSDCGYKAVEMAVLEW